METQVKGTMKYYYTPPQWLKLKRLKTPSFREDMNSQNSETLLEGYKMAQPLQKMISSFTRKLKIEPPQNPAILRLGIYQKKMKTLI